MIQTRVVSVVFHMNIVSLCLDLVLISHGEMIRVDISLNSDTSIKVSCVMQVQSVIWEYPLRINEY